MDNSNKRIKVDLDIDLDELYSILYYNYQNDNLDKIIKIYDMIKNEKLTNNIILLIAITMIELKIYHMCLEILKNDYIDQEIIDFNFYKLMNIDVTGKLNDTKIIRNYLSAVCYENIKSFENASDFYNKTKNNAKKLNLLNFVSHIDKKLIKIYESNIDKYFNELIDLYKLFKLHKKVIYMYEKKNMINDINNYIRIILDDIYVFMQDESDTDYYIDKITIINEMDITFLLKIYKDLEESEKFKVTKLTELLNTSIEKNFSIALQLNILYDMIHLTYNKEKLKYCELFFEKYENIINNLNNNENLNIIKNYVINIYNIELSYSTRLGNKKYEKYLNRKNKDIINNNYAIYLNLYKYFDINNIKKDNCVICLKENIEIITLNCHNTHILCYKCYQNIDTCPLCRDIIYK